MHLSQSLQNELYKLHSDIRLACTVNGDLPAESAFLLNEGRRFYVEFGPSEDLFSLVLLETTESLTYETCHARGLFHSLATVAAIIQRWVEREEDIVAIQGRYDGLILNTGFTLQLPDSEMESAWRKVKNRFFKNSRFWKDPDWEKRNDELLITLKAHPYFQALYPFTSINSIRFSRDKNMVEAWPLCYQIVTVTYSPEVPDSVGKYYVSFNEVPTGGRFFMSVTEAVDFYAGKLEESDAISS